MTTTCTIAHDTLPGIDKPVTRLAQGTMMIHTRDQAYADNLLDAVFNAGCNTFDTAHCYGMGACEQAFGQWMHSRGNRNQIVILGKGAHPYDGRNRVTPDDITADLNESLDRLQTDYIDIYLLHRDDPTQPVGPIVETLNQHRTDGKIRCFGGSNWTHQRIAEANAYAYKHNLKPFAVSSPNFSLAQQFQSPWGDSCISISGPDHADARQWYAQHRMPLFTWSSIARGFFSGRWDRTNYQQMAGTADDSSIRAYCHEPNFQRLDRVRQLAQQLQLTVPQIALAWVINQPLNIFALVGCRSEQEFIQCRDAANIQLTDHQRDWLNLEID